MLEPKPPVLPVRRTTYFNEFVVLSEGVCFGNSAEYFCSIVCTSASFSSDEFATVSPPTSIVKYDERVCMVG